MSCAVRPAPDRAAFIAAVDRYAADFGLPTYSELAKAAPDLTAALERSERQAADLYAALREVTEHAAAAAVCLMFDGEHMVAEAQERATAGRKAGGIALSVTEMRVDLDGRDDVAVLADARERLRAVGRRR